MQEHYAALGVEAILLTIAASTASALLFVFTAMVMCADRKKVYKNKAALRDQPQPSLPQFMSAPPQPPTSMSDKLSLAPLPTSKISDRTQPSASGSRWGRSRKDARGDPTRSPQSSRPLSGSNRSYALPYPKERTTQAELLLPTVAGYGSASVRQIAGVLYSAEHRGVILGAETVGEGEV